MLLVGSKVRAEVKEYGLNFSSDALEGLNHWVHFLIEQAAHRTVNNKRKTVKQHDFMGFAE